MEKIKIKKLWNDLDEYEMNKLEAKVNTEIEILKKKENKVRKIIKDIEKSNLKLEELEMMKTGDALLKEIKDKELEFRDIQVNCKSHCLHILNDIILFQSKVYVINYNLIF